MNLAHPSRTAKTVSQCVINDLWVKMKSVKCNFSNAAALFTSLLYKYYILTSQTFFHKKKKKKNLYSYRTVSHAKGYRLSEDLYLSNSLLVLC